MSTSILLDEQLPISSSSTSLSSSSSSSLNNTQSTANELAKEVVEEQQESGGICAQQLAEQCWYWGNTAKEAISAAMEGQPNGTFAVRDASIPGQYTLTLRIDGGNKLIKILVQNEKCGFTPDCLDFDSLTGLIQFYRTCSLRDFNDKLDTCLLHPLTSPQWLAVQTRDKSKTQMDPAYRVRLLKCRLEGFHAEYDRVSRRYDQLFGQRGALSEEHKRKQQTAAAYADALRIFERKIGELRRSISEEKELTDRDQEALAMNVELQEERMDEIGKAQALMNTAIQNIGQTLGQIDKELEELKPRLLRLHKKRDKCRDKLLAMPKQHQPTHAQLDRLVQGVSLALDSEPSTLSQFLLRTPLPLPKWDCEQWLWHEGTKDQAIALIRALLVAKNDKGEEEVKTSDVIFLIRPSSSRPGFYALEISKDGNVHSCLVEYRDPRTTIDHCGGYGFAHTQMLFPSLFDFVRYYSVVPLKEHNAVLDTPLIKPALGLQKREQKRHNKMNAAAKANEGTSEKTQ